MHRLHPGRLAYGDKSAIYRCNSGFIRLPAVRNPACGNHPDAGGDRRGRIYIRTSWNDFRKRVLSIVDKRKVCHWFTVDTFDQLRHDGRVSSAAAAVGTALYIKSLLHLLIIWRLLKI